MLHGEIPYIDFFFHHFPLMIYVYAPFMVFGNLSLLFGKLISCCFILLTGYIIYRYLKAEKFSDRLAAIFAMFFFVNAYILDWMSVIRVYALSTFLFVAVILCFGKLMSDQETNRFDKKYQYLLIGVLVSLLLLTKIVFLANAFICFIFLVYYLYKNNGKIINNHFVIFTIGFLLPLLLFLLIYKDNLQLVYEHLFRANFLFKENLQPNYFSHIYKPFLFLVLPQHIILFTILMVSGFKYNLFEKFIAVNIIIYFVCHFFTLLLLEYAVSITPLLIFLSIMRFDKFERKLKRLFAERFKLKNPAAFILVSYLLSFPFSLPYFKYMFEGKFIMFNTIQLIQVSEMLNNIDGEKVLTSWEGYTVYSRKETINQDRYMSNFFPENVDETIRNKFRISFPEDYRKPIINREPDIIVYDENDPSHLLGSLSEIHSSYKEVLHYKNLRIYNISDRKN
jgi:hypothetical protein